MYLSKKISIVFFTFFLSIFFIACEEKKDEKDIKQIQKLTKVDIHTIKKQTYPIWVNFSGKTEAFKNVSITSRVTGELENRFFEAGDDVKKDQLLFKIDDTKYKNIVEQKEAILQKDKANLNLAIASVKRYAPLVEKGLAPKEKLDQLIAEQKQLKAVVDSDFATLKQAKLDVEYTNIKATINGTVGKPLVDIGNMINASSTELTKIVQSKSLYVNFNPSTDEVSLIKKYRSQKKSKVKVIQSRSDYNSVETTGHVDFIDSVTNETTGTVAMRAIIQNDENLLLPGTFVEIKLFITDEIPVFAVSPSNISQNQLGSYVLVVNNENKIETRQIELSYSNEDLIIIKNGLKENDRIIVSDITKLRNGMSVEATQVENPIKL